MEEASWRSHHERVIMGRRHHKGVIMEESSRRSHHGGVIMEESSWRSHHGGVMEESSRRSHHGGVIMEHGVGTMEESGSSQGALCKLSGDSLGALWRLGWPWGGHGAIWASEVHFA